MELWQITLLIFGLLIILLALGLPIAFALAGIGIIVVIIFWGVEALILMPSAAFAEGTSFVLIAVPLFILMANLLETSGIADDLYGMMYHWSQGIPGGLASGTVVICAIFAAMAGISGVATVTMGLIAIPSMLNRDYDKLLITGTVAAGGALGILIPPSIIAILYGAITGASVGKLFMGGLIPGIILASIFIMYITIRCLFQPELAPVGKERFSWLQKLASLKSVTLPFVLIVLVLGTIYTGVCTPTESAGIGAMGAIICSAIYRKLTWGNIKTAVWRTFNITVMAIWIVFGAKCFASAYTACGASRFMLSLVSGLHIAPLAIIGVMEFIYIILGMLIDPAGMCMITIPVFLPIVLALGFDPIWFGVLFIINSEMAYITPPFGFNLFYMRAIVPPEITMGDVYRSIVPFVFCQLSCLILVMFVPQIAMWLPNTMR